jgi:predicted nucleotide-binding protein
MIQTNQSISLYETDKSTLDEIIHDIVIPYNNEQKIQFDGYFLTHNQISRIIIKQSEKTIKEIIKLLSHSLAITNARGSVQMVRAFRVRDAFNSEYTQTITKDVFSQIKQLPDKENIIREAFGVEQNSKIFIVHGHDNAAKSEVARFLERLKLEPIILHEQPNAGKTIIEKIDHYSDVGYGIIIYTPCDVGRARSDKKLNDRARQNVLIEHGYLLCKLGRRNVCALVKEGLEIPSDMDGIVYTPFDEHGAWHMKLVKELEAAGYKIDRDLM